MVSYSWALYPHILYFKMWMWMWILTGLNIVTKVHGYASFPFPESCESMSPQHLNSETGQLLKPWNTEPPFEIYYNHGKQEEPITVFLRSKTSKEFRGFMLEAREQGRVDESHPVGKFILLDPDNTQLLTCGGLSDSAVIQKTNRRKFLINANWTAQGEKLDIIFRATFLQSYEEFWERVDVNVTSPSQTTSTTKPSTTASTTKPSTTASTTKPSTTASTTKPSTTASTTATTTKLSTAEPHITNSPPNILRHIKAAGFTEMLFDSLIVVLKMELSNILTTFTTSPFSHRLNKGLKISCSVLCAALEISTLVLFCVGDFNKVILIPLVVVMIVINFIELVIVSLPFGPSHELKDICNIAVKVCSVIHQIFTIAVMFVGVLEVDSCKKNKTESWLLTVMAAYTAWIFLFLIWVFIFSTHSLTKLGRSKIVNSSERWEQQRKKKKLSAAEVTVSAVSVILIAGTTAFTVAFVYGIFGCQKK